MHPVLKKLTGDDRRSIGAATAVAREIVEHPDLVAVVVGGLSDRDPVLRMRAADALEKASRDEPGLLGPHKAELLGELAEIEQQEVRWHIAQILPRLSLNNSERRRAWRCLVGYLEDDSRIVQANSLQGLAHLAEQDPALRAEAIAIIEQRLESGSPAVQARARKLRQQLEN